MYDQADNAVRKASGKCQNGPLSAILAAICNAAACLRKRPHRGALSASQDIVIECYCTFRGERSQDRGNITQSEQRGTFHYLGKELPSLRGRCFDLPRPNLPTVRKSRTKSMPHRRIKGAYAVIALAVGGRLLFRCSSPVFSCLGLLCQRFVLQQFRRWFVVGVLWHEFAAHGLEVEQMVLAPVATDLVGANW